MSLPSYDLSKQGDTWICSGVLPSGRLFRFDAGTGSRDRAVGVAESRLKAKLHSSEGSKKRWEKWKSERANGVSRSAPEPRPNDEALRAKLLGLGDARPITPDGVIPPQADGAPAGTGPAAAAPEEVDEEGAELISSLLASAATIGLVAAVNARLKKRKPPQHAEPHEKGLQWFKEGMQVQLQKIIGKTATLGPVGKIFAGGAIIVGSMILTAEPIDPSAHETTTTQQAEPPQPPPTANGTTIHTPPAPPPPPQTLQLGVFGVGN